MKIIIQHTHYENQISGVLTYINSIVPELESKGADIRIISTKTNNILEWLRSVMWTDIVHMNSNNLAFAIFCKLFRKKIIIKYHYLFYQSTHFEYQPMTFTQRLKTEFIYSLPKANYPLKWKLHTAVKWARLAIRIATALLADRHIACSQFLAESQAFPWSVFTLYNPIALSNNLELKSLADLSQPYTFVFVGRLDKDKGVDILLEAVRLLQDWHQNFQVLIIGDSSGAKTLPALASELGVINYIQFLGKLPHSEVLKTVKTSLALIAPSRWQEPAGYVVLEASSVQTCSIVSNMGGLPEMAGSSSLIFNNEDAEGLAQAMKYCLEHPQQAIERGQQASRYVVAKFSTASAASGLMEIAQELLSTPIKSEKLENG